MHLFEARYDTESSDEGIETRILRPHRVVSTQVDIDGSFFVNYSEYNKTFRGQLERLGSRTYSGTVKIDFTTSTGTLTVNQINSTMLGDYPDWFVLSDSEDFQPFLAAVQPRIDAMSAASAARHAKPDRK